MLLPGDKGLTHAALTCFILRLYSETESKTDPSGAEFGGAGSCGSYNKKEPQTSFGELLRTRRGQCGPGMGRGPPREARRRRSPGEGPLCAACSGIQTRRWTPRGATEVAGWSSLRGLPAGFAGGVRITAAQAGAPGAGCAWAAVLDGPPAGGWREWPKRVRPLTEPALQNSLRSRRALKGFRGLGQSLLSVLPEGLRNRPGPLGSPLWLRPRAHSLRRPMACLCAPGPLCAAAFQPSPSPPQGLLPIVLEAAAYTLYLKRKRRLLHFLPGVPSGNTSPTEYNQGRHTTSCVTP